MFNKRTVFVVGAGASAEFGLPVGSALQQQIAGHLRIEQNNDDRIHIAQELKQSLDQLVGGSITSDGVLKTDDERVMKYVRACRSIAGAMHLAPSIDKFLDDRKENLEIVQCGKLGIAYCLLVQERQSSMNGADGENRIELAIQRGSLSSTWINSLFRSSVSNTETGRWPDILRNIAFIVFNYDRCIEHYLYQAIQTYYGLSGNDAADLLRHTAIYHPYGTIGRLPWQSVGLSDEDIVEFGSLPANLVPISERIRTFSEQIEDEDHLNGMRHALSDAEKVIFLGFSFHPMNMRLLKPYRMGPKINISGTKTGISTQNWSTILPEILSLFAESGYSSLGFEDQLAFQFMEQFRDVLRS